MRNKFVDNKMVKGVLLDNLIDDTERLKKNLDNNIECEKILKEMKTTINLWLKEYILKGD